MKKLWQLVLVILMVIYVPQVMAHSVSGRWITIDDISGKKRAQVELTVQDHVLSGKIVRVYTQQGDEGICAKCPGAFKNKPVAGLVFLWGLQRQRHQVWVGGHILDPKTGQVYRVKLRLKGDKLYVRAFVGFAMLGRTQIWVREHA